MVYDALLKIIPPARVRNRYIDRVSYASDAGFYHLVPEAVVFPENDAEICALFAFSRQYQMPLVFRGGGTSLSGQSITDGILADLSQHWKKVTVEQEGSLVRVQPGITGSMVNAHLKKFRRKIGPDPSSIHAAMMGGILSNNSSGMCCGVKLNAYHTLKHIRFILPDGQTFSTELPADYTRFRTSCPELYQTLEEIRRQIHADPQLQGRIRAKYQLKNTVGYSLNAFLDFEHPLDILAHLLIGAEGTLAFIAEAVLHTVPDYPCKSTALLYFPDISAACEAIMPLTQAGAMMVELMDRASLRAVQDLKGMPQEVKSLPDEAAALLVEFQHQDAASLAAQVDAFLQQAPGLSLLNAPVFTEDPGEQEFLWRMRKGLFPAVGAVRASGTTVILEDVAFPVDTLGAAITGLQELFRKYGYTNAILFGHAKDGNLHFVVTQPFSTESDIRRYDAFIREVVHLVVRKYNGSLKAEHGTGRNMAPFVETEWGADAYQIIQRIKQAADPGGLLNPGVIVNAHADAHIRDLKELPTVEPEVDRCIECGYCEPQCPSRDLTTSPRRRIVVRRVLKSLQEKGDQANYQLLLKQYQYDGIDTCAVDGLCATACPVEINTGDLVKRLRREQHSPVANRMALWLAKCFGLVAASLRLVLYVGGLVNQFMGRHTMYRLTKFLRRRLPGLPLWTDQLGKPPGLEALRRRVPVGVSDPHLQVVYFPSCISRVLGTYPGQAKNLMETFLSICDKAGIAVTIPHGIGGACCGQIFSSKGYTKAYEYTANSIVATLWKASGEGTLPVVTDVSSCAFTLHQLRPVLNGENKLKFDRMVFWDSIVFLAERVVPRITVTQPKNHIALHPVCALEKMHTRDLFIGLARHFARDVVVPAASGCCGMAGDRGFIFPELTASATRDEAAGLRGQSFDGFYATTTTCEMALSAAVQENYESILYLVDETI